MKARIFTFLIFVCCSACMTSGEKDGDTQDPENEMAFDEARWKMKDGADYPYRDKMLNDILYNDWIRGLHKDEVLDLLGEPERTNDQFLYYLISQKRLGAWPLHTKMLVFKFYEDNTIEWIKIHE